MSGGFHAGEQALQREAGSFTRLQALAPQILREYMPEQHRELFGKLPTLLLGALDGQGWPWATMLAGRPGSFISTPDERHLQIRTGEGSDDPVLAVLHAGSPVGLLGLENPTRRRNRVNGVVERRDADGGLRVAVRQSFGNCPKHIVPREPAFLDLPPPHGEARLLGPALDEAARALIRRSDTFFIASASARPEAAETSEGVDVSHRGGSAGFVRIEQAPDSGAVRLSVPDYPGNQFFMTLGNLSLNPRAGLLFVDWPGGGLLHLSAEADIARQGAGLAAQRSLHLHVRQALWRPSVLPVHWREAGGRG